MFAICSRLAFTKRTTALAKQHRVELIIPEFGRLICMATPQAHNL
ncbi:hypothetical protein ACRWQN_00860 [Shewanella sp. HL-SH8]